MGAKPFKDMSDDELIEFCRQLYLQEGIQAILYKSLSKRGTLYSILYSRGLAQKKILEKLGLTDEYKVHKESSKRWTWERIIKIAKEVQEKEGFLPPAGWFQKNGYASLIQGIYNSGYDWEKLRAELGDFKSSSFVESRCGLRWRSHPEASLSNFLYARGIEHKCGERYAVEYKNYSDANYAYYDLHFKNKNGDWVDVEIWGDKPNGHDEEHYSQKRKSKETFNEKNLRFVGIQNGLGAKGQLIIPFRNI